MKHLWINFMQSWNPRMLLGCIAVFSFLFAQTVSAQVVINEVQIAPTGERFVELYNPDDADVDLTGWYIQRKTESGTSFSSLVTSTQFKDKIIKSHNYFLISRGGGGSSHVVIDNLTLTNGNTLRMRNAKGEDVDQVAWGAVGEGESYQKSSSGEWSIAAPTPGVANTLTQGSNSSSSNSSTITENTTTVVRAPADFFDPMMYARISVRSGSITSGAPTFFLGEVVDGSKKPVDNAVYMWAFGDGETGFGKDVSHVFRYPGEYIVHLEVSSSRGGGPVVTRTKVIVSPAELRVELQGENSNVVVVSNDGGSEVDLSSWVIESGYRRFTIPPHTMILARGTITLAPEVTGFREVMSSVHLLYPNWQRYESSKKEPQEENIPRVASSALRASAPAKILSSVDGATADRALEVVSDSQDQTASIANAFGGASSSQNENGIWIWYTSVALLGAAALIGLRFVKGREEKTVFTADDFEIIEDDESATGDEFDKNEPH